MKAKTIYSVLGVVLVALVWVVPTLGGMSSPLYEIPVHVLDNGGTMSTSASYTNVGALGQPTPVGIGESETFRNEAGYVAQLAGLKGQECWDNDGDGYNDEVCGGSDCDDSDPDVNPGVDESLAAGNCDDGVDNDCDGLVDLDDPDCIECWDNDGDDYEDDACGGTDCDDSDPDVNPGAGEGPPGDPTCSDGKDNDCDDFTDMDDGGCVECIDDDEDGYGDPASESCLHPELDCDDADPDVNPGATEGPQGDPTCSDGKDNDCDGSIDGDDSGCGGCFFSIIF